MVSLVVILTIIHKYIMHFNFEEHCGIPRTISESNNVQRLVIGQKFEIQTIDETFAYSLSEAVKFAHACKRLSCRIE